MPNLIGQSLGRYHILEQLGEGGMAVVYKAYDTRLESDVAVKVIRTENLPQSGVERALKRFEREAKSLAKLTHPNIVPIIDYGEYEGSPYLVMKYLPGGTLKQRLGTPMPYQEAARILAPIARALEYAHQHDIIHRDVKPSNILITESGQPMLSDFGVAKILEADETMDLTGTSMGVGTPEYMAPEQVTSKTADARADIYSLGVVFFELVTGRKPFVADTPMAVLFKQASEPLPRPRQFVLGLPEAVEKVLFKALAKKPEDRYQSMGDFAVALERLGNWQTVGAESKLGGLKKGAEEPKQEMALLSTERRNKSINWGRWVAISGLVVLVLIGVALEVGLLNKGQENFGLLARLATNTAIKTRLLVTTKANIPNATSTETVGISPTQTSDLGPMTLTFIQNFESGEMDGFRMMSGDWAVVPENSSNKVLQVREDGTQNWPSIQFGPVNFHNGTIQYRFNIVQTDSTNPNAGMEYIFFRVNGDWPGNSYTLQVQSLNNLEDLNYVPQNSDNWPSLGNKSINISPNHWYTVKLELNGWRFTVYLDNAWFMEAEDISQRSSSGLLGFQGSPGTTILFDDVQVWEPSR